MQQQQSRLRQLPRQQQQFFNCGCCKSFTLCDHCRPSNPTLRGWRVSVSGLIEVPFDSDDALPGNCNPYPSRTCSYDVSGAEGDYFLISLLTGGGAPYPAACSWDRSRHNAIVSACTGCGIPDGGSSYTVTVYLQYTTGFPGSVSFPWWASIADTTGTYANYRAADADCSGAVTLSKYAEAIGSTGVTFPSSLTFTPVS